MGILGAKDSSFLKARKVPCSGCTNENDQQTRTLIKSTFKDLDKVISGEFFDVECPNCHTVSRHSYPFVYVDYDSFINIVYLDDLKRDKKYPQTAFGKLDNEIYDALKKKLNGDESRIKFGYVSNLYEFRERLAEFNDSQINPSIRQGIKRKLIRKDEPKEDTWVRAVRFPLYAFFGIERSDKDIADWYYFGKNTDGNLVYENPTSKQKKLLSADQYKTWKSELKDDESKKHKSVKIAKRIAIFIAILVFAIFAVNMGYKVFRNHWCNLNDDNYRQCYEGWSPNG